MATNARRLPFCLKITQRLAWLLASELPERLELSVASLVSKGCIGYKRFSACIAFGNILLELLPLVQIFRIGAANSVEEKPVEA